MKMWPHGRRISIERSILTCFHHALLTSVTHRMWWREFPFIFPHPSRIAFATAVWPYIVNSWQSQTQPATYLGSAGHPTFTSVTRSLNQWYWYRTCITYLLHYLLKNPKPGEHLDPGNTSHVRQYSLNFVFRALIQISISPAFFPMNRPIMPYGAQP